MARRRVLVMLALLPVLAGGAAGCGTAASTGDGLAHPDFRLITPPPYVGAPAVHATPAASAPRMTARDAARLRPVIAAWAAAVRRGEERRAARYFALPAIVYQPSFGAVTIRSRTLARAFNSALPCGARLLGARPSGRYIVGTFRLEPLPGRHCTTPSARLRVGFVFGDQHHPRRFSEWWWVPAKGKAPGPPRRPSAPAAKASLFS
jgi:hypothetical protein